jgi:hypothetical protein
MTETIRTLIYIVIGLVALGVAWLARPAAITYETLDDSGKPFFTEFDPLDAKSMEIVAVNQETMERRAFKVAQQGGRWVIPSKQNYPADAPDHLARAAASVMDVTRGTVVSDSPANHDLYGVADPTAAGDTTLGAGTRVTLRDASDKSLVDLILGKTVKDKPELRYVRIPGRDRVYTAHVSTESLSTKFEDWIERDLLQLDAMMIKEIVIDDYSVDVMNQRVNRGERMTLRFDQTAHTWTLVEPPLKDDESLQTAKLDEMRTSLDNLQIVDVYKKPAGLTAQLQTLESMQINDESVASLLGAGYYIVNGQLLSNRGETIIRLRNGVEYALRFGEIINYDAGNIGEENSANPATEPGRYLFVTAHFNAGLIDPPQYDPVPELAEGSEPTAAHDQACEAVAKGNEDKRNEYETRLAEGQQKVNDLNARFANWYYVVSDKVYQQVRLQRTDMVGPKAADSPAPE